MPAFPAIEGVETEIGLPESELTTAVDVVPYLEVKRAAMVAHARQIGETSFFLKLSRDVFAAIYGTEWYRRQGAPAGRWEDDLFDDEHCPLGGSRW